jgi:hypothetical protein
MRSTKHWMRRARIGLSADENLLQQVRVRIYQHLCAERAQLAHLMAELLGADLSAVATYGQLRRLGHRLGDAAAAYDSAPIVEAAIALERATIEAIERQANNQSERVWQAIDSLIKLLPMGMRGTPAASRIGRRPAFG